MELNGRFLFHQDKLPTACFRVFQDMKREGKLCDVTIKFTNNSISAHRLVLAAAIPYFRDMFSNSEVAGNISEVIMAETDPCALQYLIDFAYSNEVEITGDNVKTLLQASCSLKMEDVRKACCDFLGERLNPQNVMIIREMAEKLNCGYLVEISDSYVCEYFDEVAQTEDFVSAPFSFIKELLKRDDLRTSSEEMVFQFVMKWVKKSPDDRKYHLPELLSSVRLTLLSPDYLMDHVLTEEHIRESIPCRDLLDKIKFYHLLPHRSEEFSSFEVLSRPCPRNDNQSVIDGIYAICKEEKHKVLHLDNQSVIDGIYAICKEEKHKVLHLDLEKGEWRAIKTTPITKHGAAASYQGKLYFIDYNSLSTYSPPNATWKSNSNYYPGRKNPEAAILNNNMYVCGGLAVSKQLPSKTVECFDLEKQKNRKETSMSVSRNLHGVLALGEYLYVLGGKSGKRVYDSVERFDPRTSQWEVLSSMNNKRYGMGCATMCGNIYVCGGISSDTDGKCLSSAEVYDPVVNEWKYVSSMNAARWYCSLVAYCGKLYAIGGFDGQKKYLNSVEIYNPETNEWKLGPEMDSSYTNVRAVAVTPVRD